MLLCDFLDDGEAEAALGRASRHGSVRRVRASAGRPTPSSSTIREMVFPRSIQAVTWPPRPSFSRPPSMASGAFLRRSAPGRSGPWSIFAITGSSARRGASISRRALAAGQRHQRGGSAVAVSGCGMRAKRENSSTIRLMSPAWRTMTSAYWFRFSPPRQAACRCGEDARRQLDGRQRVLDFMRDAAGDVAPGGLALRRDERIRSSMVTGQRPLPPAPCDRPAIRVSPPTRTSTCALAPGDGGDRSGVDLGQRRPCRQAPARGSSSRSRMRHAAALVISIRPPSRPITPAETPSSFREGARRSVSLASISALRCRSSCAVIRLNTPERSETSSPAARYLDVEIPAPTRSAAPAGCPIGRDRRPRTRGPATPPP